MTELLKELEAVVGLAEKATPGEWLWSENGNILGHMPDGYDPEREIGAIYTERDDDKAPANAEAIIAAMQFIRAHHAEIAEALKDKTRLDWLEARFSAPSAEFPNRVPGTWQELEPTGRWLFTPRGTRSAYLGGSMREVVDKAMADYPIDAHNSAREVGE